MTISKCRRDLLHKEPNGIISTKLEVSDKNFAETKCLANEIPICSLQLCGLRVEKAVEGLEEERGCALGYIDQYKTETWDAWMNSFQLQTCTRYSIRKGKHIPMKTEKHGLVQYSEKIVGYTVKHSQTYHCFRAGNGRLKPEKDDPLLRRSAPGSKCMGCPAKIHTRLLLLKNGIEVLEVKIPLLSVHKEHDPSSAAVLICLRPLPEIEEKVKSLVQQAYLRQVTLKLTIEDWVEHELIPQHLTKEIIQQKPSRLNRVYYPNRRDIRNMSRKAIIEQRTSKFDQEVLEMYLKEKGGTRLKYFLKKYTNHKDM